MDASAVVLKDGNRVALSGEKWENCAGFQSVSTGVELEYHWAALKVAQWDHKLVAQWVDSMGH